MVTVNGPSCFELGTCPSVLCYFKINYLLNQIIQRSNIDESPGMEKSLKFLSTI